MSLQHQNQFLEMNAQCILNDISNQQDRKTKFNWVSKKNTKQKSSLKFPSLSAEKQSQKAQFKYKPWLIRRKENLYRQKINEMLSDVQKDANFVENCLNYKSPDSIDKQNIENRKSLIKNRRYDKCKTQNDQQQNNQNNTNYHKSFLLSNKREINDSKLKKNWSVHVKKALVSLSHQKQSMKKEIQSIKSLIEDKRTKCRLLSKQGYIILKQQPTDNKIKNFGSCIEIVGQKNKSAEKVKDIQKNTRQRSSLSIFSSNRTNQNVVKCKSFLINAYEILSLKPSEIIL